MKNHKLPGICFFPFEDDLMHFLDSEIREKRDHLYECLRLWSGFNRYFWAFCLALICFFATNPINATAGEYKIQIDFSFDIQAVLDKQVTGYRLYKENEPACDAGVVEPQSITCTVNAEPGSYNFTLAALYDDNSESPQSPSFPFTITEPDVPPTAIIASSNTVGEAPLTVQFDGSSSSTMQPPITSYVWNFGDGSDAEGAVTSHIFLVPGTYQTTLTVTDSSGLTDQTGTTVIITEPDVPPTAIIASSTAVGDAPLIVQFDGSSSHTLQPPITSYTWNFGDGNGASGAITSHIFLIPGTYQTTLTVTDSRGLTDQTSTPVIITSAPVEENQSPISSFAATPASGTTPLTVLFDASSSSDPDGSITEYLWNFGDGSTATGISAQYTFIDVADYTVSLQVTDDKGEAAVSSQVISVLAEEETNFYFELGEVEVDHNWVIFTFSRPFIDPVVIAGPPSSSDIAPATVRIRNVNQNGFETRIQEWDYLVDNHAPETFSFMVMEKGVFTLTDGTRIEAGSFIGATRFQQFSMQQPYQSIPVVLTQVMTENEADAVTGRIQNIDQSSFEYKLQEQEKTKNRHTTETIGYIAWEQGRGEFAGLQYEAGLTTRSVTDDWFDLTFQTGFPDLPLLIAGMQTYADADTAALRYQNISPTSVLIKTEEEQSKTTETSHNPEVVGYITISSAAAAGE